jgi:hypothetical protein
VATDNFWGKFRHWRRRRPFWGGLLLLLSGLELFASGNMTIGGLEIHLGPTGFLSYLLPLILVACSLLVWFNPAQRLFYAIVALLAALYSFIGLNLGGFFVGMLLGIIGGGLIIAWGPPRPRPGTEVSGPPTGEPTDHQEDGPVDVGDDIFNDRQPHEAPTEQIQVAGHDDRPHDQRPIRPAGQAPRAEPPRGESPRAAGLQRLARNPRARALALIPVAVTATIVVASGNLPASADDTCPDGLPSISASATTAKAAAATTKKKTTTKTTTSRATTPKTKKAESAKTASATPSASASADENPILGGIKGVIDGVGNLLGIGDDSSASPSTSPASSQSTTTPAADPTTTAPADPTTDPTATATSTATATATADPTKTSATASPTAGDDVIPCLGGRIYGKVASADDIPTVAKKPGVMEVGSLTLYNSTYDGVVDMPTDGGGSYKALKFSMDKAVNKPFKLTIDEKAGNQTVITSKELTTTGTVKFYTSELKGKLFGLIPVTFTPDSPPPLTLPVLWFTDVTIQLAFVRCDTLTGDPLKIDG